MVSETSLLPNPLEGLAPERTAIFLDFDGVLVDLAESPDRILVPDTLNPLLQRLAEATGGAIAIVTGRAIQDIGAHLDPLPGWIAGSHGGERKMPGQSVEPHPLTGSESVAEVQGMAKKLATGENGVLFELKPLGAAVHYRADPTQEKAMRRGVEQIASHHGDFECHSAKMAFELRPRDVGKDKVVAEWLQCPPFMGRIPVYFGDDLTDEPAMHVTQAANGRAVKVGNGPSTAHYRLDAPADVLNQLSRWLDTA
jgi:trehalose 6-phosphate phosphatase